MGKSKQKRKSAREPQLSANSIAARKRAEQDVFYRMVATSLKRKIRGDVYVNMKKIIDYAIDVSPWMTENSLKCAARRHKQKISNNQLIYKEEAESDKSEHQPSVLSIICNTDVNGGRPKGSTLKNKKNLQDKMDEAKLHITCFSWRKRRSLSASHQEPSISFTTMS